MNAENADKNLIKFLSAFSAFIRVPLFLMLRHRVVIVVIPLLVHPVMDFAVG